jgi:hypothetical protein
VSCVYIIDERLVDIEQPFGSGVTWLGHWIQLCKQAATSACKQQ